MAIVADTPAHEARRWLLRNFTSCDRCSTAQVAGALGITASHLCHVYRETWGLTIGGDLRRLRIELAMRLLADSSLPIKEVAGQVGYGRSTYRAFFNAFHRVTGMSPSRYRRLQQRARRERQAS